MKSRITVIGTVYFQEAEQQPVAVESAHSRVCEADEQPYPRRFEVGEEWTPLPDGCWVSEASVMVLANAEGRGGRRNLTPAESEVVASHVVEVSFSGGATADAVIVPRDDMRVAPANLSAIRLRCRSGTARCSVTIFPK